MCLVDDDIYKGAAGQFLVQTRRSEVHVGGHIMPGPYQHAADEVLGAAALMGGHHIPVTIVVPNRLLHMIKIAATGVSLIAQHDTGPLSVTHSACAAVSKQVDIHVL